LCSGNLGIRTQAGDEEDRDSVQLNSAKLCHEVVP